MFLFVTAGRGTEDFVQVELKEKLKAKMIKKTDGKIFFVTDITVSRLAASLNYLKSIERAFVCLLHKSDLHITSSWQGKQQLENALKNIPVIDWVNAYLISRECTAQKHVTELSGEKLHKTEVSAVEQHTSELSMPGKHKCGWNKGKHSITEHCLTVHHTAEHCLTEHCTAEYCIHKMSVAECCQTKCSAVEQHAVGKVVQQTADKCSPADGSTVYQSNSKHSVKMDPDSSVTSTCICSFCLTAQSTGRSDCKQRRLDCCGAITFRISCKVSGLPGMFFNSQNLGRSLGIVLKHHTQWRTELRHPQTEVYIHVNNQGLTIGLSLTRKPLSERQYLKHIGLRTPIAYIMGLLAEIQTGAVVLDAMCGTSTILVETAKSWPSAYYIGCDKDSNQLMKSAQNIVTSNEEMRIELLYCDATALSLVDGSVDAIICDLPFGNIHGQEADMYALYPKLIQSFNRVLKKGGHCVLLTSERLKDLLLRVMCCERSVNSSSQRHPDVSEIHQAATELLDASILGNNSRNNPCDVSYTKLPWVVKYQQFVKLGETYAFISCFVKQ